MGRNPGQRLGIGEIATVLGGIGGRLPGFGYLRNHPARPVDAPQVFPHGGRFAEPFGQDIPGALQGLVHILHGTFHIARRFLPGTGAAALPQQVGQGLQSFGHRFRSAGLALGAVREVQVFQLGRHHAVFDPRAQLRRQFPLLGNGTQDGELALVHLREDIGPMLDEGHLHVREAAGAFFPVAADKGDGAAVVQELGAVFHLPGLHRSQLGYVLDIDFFHDLFL